MAPHQTNVRAAVQTRANGAIMICPVCHGRHHL